MIKRTFDEPLRGLRAVTRRWRLRRFGSLAVPAFALVYCLLFLYESRSLGFREAGYPRVIIGLFIVIIAAITVREVILAKRTEGSDSGQPADSDHVRGRWGPTVIIGAALVALCWLMPRIGSLAAVALFSIVLPPLLGYRKHLVTIAACAVTVALTYYAFIKEFGVPLP